MNNRILRKIITRGVIDMASSAVIEEESYLYDGPMALADDVNPTLQAAIDEALGKHFKKVKEVIEQVEKDLKENKQVAEGTKEAVAKLNVDGAKIIADTTEKQRAQDLRILDLEQKLAVKGVQGDANKQKSLGEQFTESQEFKDFVPRGRQTVKAASSPFMVKNITSNSLSGGPGIFPEYLPTPVIPAFQPLTIRDLLATGTTETNLIIWVQENVFTNNAGYQGSDGSLKPQSDITYDLKNIAVETIAHWFKASKQVLADFKILQTLINTRAVFGLKLTEEQQILFGDGATGHLHGLIPQATAYDGGYLSADTKIDTVRRAMLQTSLSFYPATGIAMSPSDWADIELTKDSYGRYMIGNPASNAPKMLWGLPIAECYSMQRGDFLVGALKLAATLFDREQASILLSTEDQDNFVRNMVTILAEERLALAVSRPLAIVYGNFKSGETG